MARNATIPTLKVPIGPNCHLDFGPFADCYGVGEWGADRGAETVMVTTDGEGARPVAIEDIEDALRSEVGEAQPVHLSTGDVRDPSTGDLRPVGYIEAPLRSGYTVEVTDAGDSVPYGFGMLGDNTGFSRTKRVEVEESLRLHGGFIEG